MFSNFTTSETLENIVHITTKQVSETKISTKQINKQN